MDPAGLFPPGPHRFRLTGGRIDPAEFFLAREPSGALLAQRRRWLDEAPERHAAMQPEGNGAWREFLALAAGWRWAGGVSVSTAWDLREAGGQLEPDILILTSDAGGSFRLRGGALCFPTGWALTGKLGATLEEIHRVVPGLNAEVGAAVTRLLAGLKPGVAYGRDNWGIAASGELNLHPERRIAPPRLPVDLSALWLRVEHQALVGLPESEGVAFGIRVMLHRLDTLAGTPAGRGLRRALEALPADLAAYKRLDQVRAELIARLD